MTVDYAKASDIENIAKTEKTCFLQPLSKNELFEILENDLYSTLVLKKDSEYIGHIIFYTVQNTAEIISVAVKESERNKGYAKTLIQDALNRCFENKTEKMLLEVRCSNKTAIALYEKTGFQIIATRKNFYEKPQEDAYTMEIYIGKEHK